jgi:IS6 family transposase
MRESRPALFRGRHFRSEVIVLCVRWYLRYPLSYRDLEEMMAERYLSIDHSTIARWVLHYGPILNRRIRREMRRPNRSWRVDETYVCVAGKWTYLYRAIDSAGDTIDFLLSPNRDLIAAKGFLQLALSAGPDPVAHHQRGRPSSLRVCNRRTEAGGRTGPELPVPAITIHEQHH